MILETARQSIAGARQLFERPTGLTAFLKPRPYGHRLFEKDCAGEDISSDLAPHYRLLLEHGRIVWGYLAQANTRLFRHGQQDAPALVIYGTDTRFDNRVERLANIAELIFSLNENMPDDPRLTRIAEFVTDHFAQPMHEPLPESLAGEPDVFMGWIMIQRRRLPTGYLTYPFLPLVICPEKTPMTMVLPLSYWTASLINDWHEQDRRDPVTPVPPPAEPPMSQGEVIAAYRESPVVLTARAARYIRQILRESNAPDDVYVRVRAVLENGEVDRGAALDNSEPTPEDILTRSEDLTICADRRSLRYLINKQLDITQGMSYIGFCFRDNEQNRPAQNHATR